MYIQVVDSQRKRLHELLKKHGDVNLCNCIVHQLADPTPKRLAEHAAYSDAAKKLYASEGKIEIDDEAIVSDCETGAYVMGWMWVPRSNIEPNTTD